MAACPVGGKTLCADEKMNGYRGKTFFAALEGGRAYAV
jgi:hypothetical protein